MTDLNAYLQALDRMLRPIRASALPTTLEPVRQLLAKVGDTTRLNSVVIAGSVGKGTTAHRLAARLTAAGVKTGLFTSPHLHSFRERFVIDGLPISMTAFTRHSDALPSTDLSSTFESALALACAWFLEQRVERTVMEIGLGGRFDAVNAVPHALALITPIELEHAAMLGGTLESIAWHKAGVIPHGGHAISAPQADAVRSVLQAEADSVGARLNFVPFDQLADAALELLMPGFKLAQPPEVSVPARLEQVNIDGRRALIDGSHTPAGGQRLRDAILQVGARSVQLVIGMLRDKDAAAYLSALDHPGWRWTLTELRMHRGMSANLLASAYAPKHAVVSLADDMESALKSAFDAHDADLVVACGSLRTAALARETWGLLSEAELEESRATRELFEGGGYLRRLRD